MLKPEIYGHLYFIKHYLQIGQQKQHLGHLLTIVEILLDIHTHHIIMLLVLQIELHQIYLSFQVLMLDVYVHFN